jgi:SAM-dependent methyltransferase
VKRLDDIARLRAEYKDRERRFSGSDVYSWLNPANLFAIQMRQRAVLKALKSHGFADLSKLSILEMGCGSGGVLAEYLCFGAVPEKLFGLDLIFDRLQHAHHVLPGSGFANADGGAMPFPKGSFDLVLQYTAISSILDPGLRRAVCAEMLRVLRSPDLGSGMPGGLILSYDFWLNPINRQTRGLGPREIDELFPGCRFTYRRITLAPPIARRLASFSWGVCAFLESLRIFNSHYLVAICKAA